MDARYEIVTLAHLAKALVFSIEFTRNQPS